MRLREATILLVDDEPELLEIFGRWIRAAGCAKVYLAANGRDALKIFESTSIDAIVTDIRMPVMDGIQLVRGLMAVGKTVPSIVFVSGFGEIDIQEMYALGVESFLPKPVRREEIVRTLERALAERRSLWMVPMEVAPRQTVEIEATGIGAEGVSLGRGGFSAYFNGPLRLGNVAFDCHFPAQHRELKGQGQVRWTSPEGKVGIEFSFIEAASLPWVLKKIEEIGPQSFIPL